jgi:hypothetical protein
MALTQWQLKPVATETTIASGDFLAFTDEDEAGDPINKITIDNLATFLAGGSNLSASSGVLSATDTNTTYTGGTNLTLVGTTFNVDDSFLTNTGDDSTSHTITMAHLIVGDGGNVGSASDGDAIAIAGDGVVTFSQNVTLADNAVINLGEAGKIDFGDEEPADDAATGIVFSFIAGASLAIGDVVYMGVDGEVLKAQADAVGTSPAIGICVSAGSDGSACDVLVQGIMHDTSAFPNFSTLGVDVFVSAAFAGDLTATAPTGSGDTVQKIGVALHADMIYFNFNTTEVLLA